jgi:PAS domain S-box-containing protein
MEVKQSEVVWALGARSARDGCLAGGGEMGEMIRAVDWSSTPLGPATSWPQSLRTAISMMLEAQFAIAIAWGPEFRLFYNDRYRPIIGAKHPAALGKPTAEIFPEIWDLVGPEFARVGRGEAVALDDWYLPLERSGYRESCWFSVSFSPIRGETGEVGGLLAIVVETTARVEGDRRLATLRELAQTAEARTPEQACANAARALGHNPTDVPFAIVYGLDDDGRTARRLAQVGLPADHAAAPDTIALTPGGEGGWPLARAARTAIVVDDLAARFGELPGGAAPEPVHTAILLPVVGAGLGPRGVLIAGVSPRRALDDRYRGFFELVADHIATAIGNARTREDHRRAEAAAAELRDTVSLLDATLGSVPVGLCFYDRELDIVRMNETLARWNGIDRDHIVGRRLVDVVPPASYERLAPHIREVFATGRTSETVTIDATPLNLPDRRQWLVTFFPIRAASGDVMQVGTVSIDITDEVRARRELASVVEYSEKFTAMLGHDLRNPLMAIMAAAQLLEQRATVAEIARPAQRIVFSVERMSRMIAQLLDLARVRVTGGLQLQPGWLDLAELCHHVLDELRQGKPGSRIELDAIGSLRGVWDGDRLAQVISNLAGNALEHGEHGAAVQVQLDGSDPDRVTIRVENRGAIADDVLPTLFDPFRGARHRRESTRGLGLGLYISKEIIAAHHGTIAVRSTRDSGTCFAIELPRDPETAR